MWMRELTEFPKFLFYFIQSESFFFEISFIIRPKESSLTRILIVLEKRKCGIHAHTSTSKLVIVGDERYIIVMNFFFTHVSFVV